MLLGWAATFLWGFNLPSACLQQSSFLQSSVLLALQFYSTPTEKKKNKFFSGPFPNPPPTSTSLGLHLLQPLTSVATYAEVTISSSSAETGLLRDGRAHQGQHLAHLTAQLPDRPRYSSSQRAELQG